MRYFFSIIIISSIVRMTFSEFSDLSTIMHWPVDLPVSYLDLERTKYSYGPPMLSRWRRRKSTTRILYLMKRHVMWGLWTSENLEGNLSLCILAHTQFFKTFSIKGEGLCRLRHIQVTHHYCQSYLSLDKGVRQPFEIFLFLRDVVRYQYNIYCNVLMYLLVIPLFLEGQTCISVFNVIGKRPLPHKFSLDKKQNPMHEYLWYEMPTKR